MPLAFSRLCSVVVVIVDSQLLHRRIESRWEHSFSKCFSTFFFFFFFFSVFNYQYFYYCKNNTRLTVILKDQFIIFNNFCALAINKYFKALYNQGAWSLSEHSHWSFWLDTICMGEDKFGRNLFPKKVLFHISNNKTNGTMFEFRKI